MMTDDNVSDIRPGVRSTHPALRGQKPDEWMGAANRLRDDMASDRLAVGDEAKSVSDQLKDALRARGIDPSDYRAPMPPFFEEPKEETPAQRRKREEAEAQAKRVRPVDPQRRMPLGVALAVAIVIFVTAALFSFDKVATAATWMKPEWPWLAWVVPGFVEAFIVYFGIDSIIQQARGNRPKSRSALGWMTLFASIAVVANAATTALAWGPGSFDDPRAWIGTAMSALAPLSVVLITKRVSALVFLDPHAP